MSLPYQRNYKANVSEFRRIFQIPPEKYYVFFKQIIRQPARGLCESTEFRAQYRRVLYIEMAKTEYSFPDKR